MYHACGCGIGVLMRLYTAKAVHQVFRDHQKIRHAVESSRSLVRIQLIYGIERLKLNARVPVEL